jgi:uncharacterized membrane protein YgcG
MNLSALIVCLLVTPAFAKAPAGRQDPGTPELRGAWLANDTVDTAPHRADLLAKLRRGHFNAVFIAVPPINGNYGTSDVAGFGAMVDDCKAAGLQVHAWFQNFKRLGESTQADFTSAAERQAQKQWFLDLLAAYPKLDGVQCDYIRYSTWEACIAAKMQGVAETVRTLKEAVAPRPLTCAVFNAAAISYRGWKPTWEGDVPQWYRDWYAAHPNNYYEQQANTPPNSPNWLLGGSFFSYQQDPAAWIKAGIADGCATMQYTAVDATWQNEVQIWKSFLGADQPRLFMGLGWMGPVQFFEDSAFDPAAMVRFIKYGRAQGVKGFVVFRLGQPGVDDGPFLDALSVNGPANGNAAPFTKDVASTLGTTSGSPGSGSGSGAGAAPGGGGGGGHSGCGGSISARSTGTLRTLFLAGPLGALAVLVLAGGCGRARA